MHVHNNKGFTLVEVMIAAYILLIGICGTLLFYVNSLNSSQFAWDSTVATTHAQYILEEMQNETDLSSIISTDWDAWAKTQNLNTLPGESFQVLYADPSANPLAIQIIDQWQRKNSPNKISLATILTR
jgi:prepilin-type N-terminal cleavage/methylation domain-containing protein